MLRVHGPAGMLGPDLPVVVELGRVLALAEVLVLADVLAFADVLALPDAAVAEAASVGMLVAADAVALGAPESVSSEVGVPAWLRDGESRGDDASVDVAGATVGPPSVVMGAQADKASRRAAALTNRAEVVTSKA